MSRDGNQSRAWHPRRRFHCEESGSDGTLGHLPSTEYTLGKCGVPSGAGAMAADLAPDLRKRIEIMAEHIARNGSEFESTVRQKNMNNPDFGFLYDGEGASYYLDVLAAHRARTRSGPDSQSLLASLRRWPEPILYPLVAEAEQQLSEVVASLEQMASRDAIRNGRAWIESNAALAPQIAGSLVKRIRTLPTASHRIHVLYLVHDVLQTQAAKKERIQALVCAFKPYLVWLLRPAYQFALSGQREEEGQRALRLLQLWVERGILAPAEAEELGRRQYGLCVPSYSLCAPPLKPASKTETLNCNQQLTLYEWIASIYFVCPFSLLSCSLKLPAPATLLPSRPYCYGNIPQLPFIHRKPFLRLEWNINNKY